MSDLRREIADVTKPSEDDETTRDWWLVSFAEPWAKPLKVNTTHQQALILMFGSETNAWKGKRIGLFAMVGTFFKKRQTAVRIKGSPDITEAKSFSVRKWGGGKDTYNLVPMAAPGSSPAASSRPPTPFVPDGTLKFKIGNLKSTQLAVLSPAELVEAIAFGKDWLSKAKPGSAGIPATAGHVAEIEAEQARRAKLEEQMNAGAPPPGAAGSEDAPF